VGARGLRHRTACLAVALATAALSVLGCTRGESGRAGVRVGEPAPQFRLPDLAGAEVTTASLAGTPTVINFWATWCLPCIGELPVLAAVERSGRARVVGLSLDEGGAAAVRPFVAEHRIPYRILLADEATATRWGAIGIPYTVVLDAGGKVVETFTGAVSPGDLDHAIREARAR
jgi:cytochrome c biogenesis protein CcmG, thiol:disulfide interchange protein DsbE